MCIFKQLRVIIIIFNIYHNLLGTKENKNESIFSEAFLFEIDIKEPVSFFDIELNIRLAFAEEVVFVEFSIGGPGFVNDFIGSRLTFVRLLRAISFTSKINASRVLRNGFGLKQQLY